MIPAGKTNEFAWDCIYFKGDKPCQPHQLQTATCRCDGYSPRSKKYLFIQLSSGAEVIRSLPIVEQIKQQDPQSYIIYLTPFAPLVNGFVDEVLPNDIGAIMRLQLDQINELYNLDMDKRACSITNVLQADLKKGFYLRDGFCRPLDEDAEKVYQEILEPNLEDPHKTIHYVQNLFHICGMTYHQQRPYLTPPKTTQPWPDYEGQLVGIYTLPKEGSVSYWETARWIHLMNSLSNQGWMPILLGDQMSEQLNLQIAEKSRAIYPGRMTLEDTIKLIHQCDTVISSDGLISEIALALHCNLVLLHDGRQRQPDLDTTKGVAMVSSENNQGIQDILPDKILEAIAKYRQATNHKEPERKAPKPSAPDELPTTIDEMRSLTAATRGKPGSY